MPDTHNTHIKAPHRARDGGGWYALAVAAAASTPWLPFSLLSRRSPLVCPPAFSPQPHLRLPPWSDPQVRHRPLPPLLPRAGCVDWLHEVPLKKPPPPSAGQQGGTGCCTSGVRVCGDRRVRARRGLSGVRGIYHAPLGPRSCASARLSLACVRMSLSRLCVFWSRQRPTSTCAYVCERARSRDPVGHSCIWEYSLFCR